MVLLARKAEIPVAVYTPPGGESVEQLSKRAREFFIELCRLVIFACLKTQTHTDTYACTHTGTYTYVHIHTHTTTQ